MITLPLKGNKTRANFPPGFWLLLIKQVWAQGQGLRGLEWMWQGGQAQLCPVLQESRTGNGKPRPLVLLHHRGVMSSCPFERNGIPLAQMRDDSLEETLALLPLHSPNRRAPFQVLPTIQRSASHGSYSSWGTCCPRPRRGLASRPLALCQLCPSVRTRAR